MIIFLGKIDATGCFSYYFWGETETKEYWNSSHIPREYYTREKKYFDTDVVTPHEREIKKFHRRSDIPTGGMRNPIIRRSPDGKSEDALTFRQYSSHAFQVDPSLNCQRNFNAFASANLLDGLEHHGHHGEHGEHGDHAHGEHAHGEHGDHAHGEHGDHAHGDHAHGEHGDHAHGEHGEHAHGDHGAGDAHGEHAHGEAHDHSHDNVQVNQDPFASALASELGGGFLSFPTDEPVEFSTAPAPATAAPAFSSFEPAAPSFEQVAPALEPAAPSFEQPAAAETPATPTFAPAAANSLQFAEEPKSNDIAAAASSAAGEAKQLDSGSAPSARSSEYPEYAVVPRTSFSCAAQETGGYFADPEAECQVFHICLNGQNMGSFLCPNGTLFHQQYFVCDWWYNVDCAAATQSYGLNAQIGVVPE
ncbi:sperm acrosomal protein FSA-ACR.1-like [Penaeus monodon]|uniref:sperm acrosomal protein FSA-ACR.1-like n=1 Tax=Penaeus monodon TaxID=6687 RepID=UPI0018A7A1CF|nr:sperm acrosomal protein FSA-ACR.1-like [Penaeus monodon]